MDNNHIIVFDGVCNLCNRGVQFVIRRDPKGVFAFTPIQSEIGQYLLKKYHHTKDISETFLLIKNGVCYTRSEAAIEVCRDLSGLQLLCNIMAKIPVSVRDFIYDLIARNRYKLFGKKESCMLPAEKFRSRFLE